MSTSLRKGISPNQFGNKFDLALEAGGEFEDFFRGLIANAHVECKREYRAAQTGNLYVEFECRGKPSGIAVTEADWWAFGIVGTGGDIEAIAVVSTPCLKRHVERLRAARRIAKGGDGGLSMDALLPIASIAKA